MTSRCHLAFLLLVTCMSSTSSRRRRHGGHLRLDRTAHGGQLATYTAPFPLRDQPNLSDPTYRRAIRGSKRAFAITKSDYLKKEWCNTEPFKQVIRERGCRRKKIINRFCYGQCNSFFIPRHGPRNTEAFRSCAFCKPKLTSWLTVTLLCPGQHPPVRRKKVLRVKVCKCMAQPLQKDEGW